MTDDQQRTLAKAFHLLEAHFDHVLIAVADREVPGTMIQPDPEISWHGGWVVAKYLAQLAGERIEYRKPMTRCPPNISRKILGESKP